MNLGKRVESARLAKSLTQVQLSGMVEGLSQQALDRLEKRDSRRSQFAPGLAKALGVSLHELLTGKPEPAPTRAAPQSITSPPSLPAALPVVLEALKRMPRSRRAALAQDWAALLAAPDSAELRDAVRQALDLAEAPAPTPTADKLLGTPAKVESAELRPAPRTR